MNKKMFIDELAAKMDMKKKDAAVMFDGFMEVLTEALTRGEDVKIPSFGTFKVTEVPERPARNPQTGEEMIVPAHKAVRFKASSVLKEAVK